MYNRGGQHFQDKERLGHFEINGHERLAKGSRTLTIRQSCGLRSGNSDGCVIAWGRKIFRHHSEVSPLRFESGKSRSRGELEMPCPGR